MTKNFEEFPVMLSSTINNSQLFLKISSLLIYIILYNLEFLGIPSLLGIHSAEEWPTKIISIAIELYPDEP